MKMIFGVFFNFDENLPKFDVLWIGWRMTGNAQAQPFKTIAQARLVFALKKKTKMPNFSANQTLIILLFPFWIILRMTTTLDNERN